MVVVTIGVLALALGLLVVAALYNGIARRRDRMSQAWRQVEHELRRRHELILKVVTAVKGYSGHEQAVFERVIAARTVAVETLGRAQPQQIARAESALTRSLNSFLAAMDGYPSLRAIEDFVQLRGQLTPSSDQLDQACRLYNRGVRSYNAAVTSFPRNVIAASCRFRRQEPYTIAEVELDPAGASLSHSGQGPDQGRTAPWLR